MHAGTLSITPGTGTGQVQRQVPKQAVQESNLVHRTAASRTRGTERAKQPGEALPMDDNAVPRGKP